MYKSSFGKEDSELFEEEIIIIILKKIQKWGGVN
jgi:hypothetical protein